DTLPMMACLTVKVEEWQNQIVFLHKVIEGVADRSYGVHVAALAGLPKTVVSRAETVLRGLEKAKKDKQVKAEADKKEEAPEQKRQLKLVF
ncbi:MAG: hypothetical protein NWR39_02130, partial [Pseudomonadota bacterium]|nr:hypothetical protein [Pseudomonadota bacterium]